MKRWYLQAEESGIDLKTGSFLQPWQEIRASYDHLARAFDCDLESGHNNSEEVDDKFDYISLQLDKAMGHQYRAFFDTSDFLGMQMRKRAIEALSEFSTSQISKAIPNYYSEIRPQFEDFNRDIAKLRGSKDIGKTGKIIEEAEQYDAILQNMMDLVLKIENAIPSLTDLKEEDESADRALLEKKAAEEKKENEQLKEREQILLRENRTSRRTTYIVSAIGFFATIAGSLLTWYLTKP